MTRIFTTAVALGLSLAAAVPATADVSQLVSGSGLSSAEAQGLTLNQLAAMKLSRGSDPDAWHTVYVRTGQVGIDPARHAQLIAAAEFSPEAARGLTLNDLAAGKHNAEASYDDRQGTVSMSSRGAVQPSSQLIAAAGLTPAEAHGMSLTEIAARKFDREARYGDRQGVGY